MASKASKFLDDHDEWLEYVLELVAIRGFADYLTEQADYMSNQDRRYVLRQVSYMQLHIGKVEYGIRPPRRVDDYREWNVLRMLDRAAMNKGITLAEYIEDFEYGQTKIWELRNPMAD